MIWESSENQFGRPKKRSTKFEIFFENPPALEKILDPSLPRVAVADLGGRGVGWGGGLGRPLFQEFDPLTTQKSALGTILDYSFLQKDPKSFLKKPLAPL